MENEKNDRIKILFVDDEPNILDGLRRMLRPCRQEWDMAFAGNGYEALQYMDQKPFDVVVTDMRMPGMDGANLLQEISLRYPHIVRFVLSGQSDRQTILRAVGPTHQFMSKPCEADYLRRVIHRSLTRRNVVTNETVRNKIAQIKTMPSPMETCQALSRNLEESVPQPDAIAQIIGGDVALTAKTFQLINSDLFGHVKNLQNVGQAVNILGVEVLTSMLETSDLFTVYDAPADYPFSMDLLQKHSRLVAHYARRIAESAGVSESQIIKAWLAGMLHDVGQLILVFCMPEEYARLLQAHPADSTELCRLEKEMFGASHPEAGAYLLSLWGFSDAIVEAVEYYYEPSSAAQQEHPVLAAVHLAHAVSCRELGLPVKLNAGFVAQNGLQPDVEQWIQTKSDLTVNEDERHGPE